MGWGTLRLSRRGRNPGRNSRKTFILRPKPALARPAVTGSPVGDFLRELHRRVVEDRSGDVFNAIRLEAGSGRPRIEIVLLQNIALGLCQKLRKLNREISVFDC